MTKNSGARRHKTWVEIDAGILRGNLEHIRAAIGPDHAIVLVVKSDAYGHGAGTVASVAAETGVSHFAVVTIDEGIALRRADVGGEILLLHPPLEFEVPAAIEWRLTPSISDESTARLFSGAAAGSTLPVHVEVDTGLSRLGLDWEGAAGVIARVAALPHLKITGIYTHFRAADGKREKSVRMQMQRFERALQQLREQGVDVGFRHVASSLGLVFHPESGYDGIRPGMIVYGGMDIPRTLPGVSAHPERAGLEGIRPVMSVRTRILHLRTVRSGEWIHYGETYQAARDMRIAVLPIGYGMGYPRHLSNNGEVLIAGQRAPIVGAIGMDLTMVDVSALKQAAVGDVVTVLGYDHADEISAVELAGRVGTIPYEITIRLGNSLPRYVVNAAQARDAAAPALARPSARVRS